MTRRFLRPVLAIAVTALLLAGAVAAAAAPVPAQAASPLIVITNFSFTGDLAVSPGVTVTVRNDDAVMHTLTAVDGSFTTPVIQPGTSATFVAPSTPGSYTVTCQIHSFMSGTLVVAPASPTPAVSSSASGPAAPLIVITNFTYTGDLTVPPGVTVTVRNADPVIHTLTAVDGSFTTPVIQPGTTATFVAPSTPGNHAIKCKIHSFMSGTLVVATGGSPSASPSTSGNVSAEPPTSGSFSVTRGGCAAMFTVVSRWAGGFQAAVMVMNGPAPRSSWTVSWTFPSGRTLTHLWNGTVSQSGATVTVHNASFNGALAPNASTEFGLLGSWHPSNSEPVALTCQ